jgi:YbgC/YbaW family acyl-CoA thioester hydrolase
MSCAGLEPPVPFFFTRKTDRSVFTTLTGPGSFRYPLTFSFFPKVILMAQPLLIDKPKVLESLIVARFQDCDPFGHLNNARYIDYFLNARQDQILEHYDFRTYQPGMAASWVVRTTQISYLRPVAAMEEILIRTRLVQFGETSLVMEGLMLDREARSLKALIWIDFVYVSLSTGRPARHAPELTDLFAAVVVDGPHDPDGFSRRVETVRQEIKSAARS